MQSEPQILKVEDIDFEHVTRRTAQGIEHRLLVYINEDFQKLLVGEIDLTPETTAILTKLGYKVMQEDGGLPV